MPAGFEHCRTLGGKVRTKTLSNGKYMHICILGDKTYAGEVKTKKSAKKAQIAICL